MSKIENAVKWMENTAADNSHGYDQQYRWGEKGDYDCSAAVITACEQAGIPLKTNGATYTGNIIPAAAKCGFVDVTAKVNLTTGAGMVRGDILIKPGKHVAMYCGNGKEVEASINEKGKATGGKPGDQTGKEFLVRSYRNYPWSNVLRYVEPAPVKTEASKKEEAKVTDAKKTYAVTGGSLYVRVKPNGDAVGILENGTKITCQGHVETVKGVKWLRIPYKGKQCWVKREFMKLVK